MFAPIFACLIGCGPQIAVSVDAKAAPEARSAGRFTIAPGDPYEPVVDPDFITLSRQAARALASQGFEEARSPDDSDLMVMIDWTTGKPKQHVHHIGGDAGAPQVSGSAPGAKGMPVGGTTNSSSFGMGMEATDGIEIDYPQTFTFKAVDRAAYKADPKTPSLWEITLTSETQVKDPSLSGAPMIAAAIPYMARTAKARVRLGLAEAPVKYVRGEIAALPATTASK